MAATTAIPACAACGLRNTYKELEEAAKQVAAEKKAGFAGEFRKAGSSADEALKREFWVWDRVHLGPKGHELARDVVLRAIETD